MNVIIIALEPCYAQLIPSISVEPYLVFIIIQLLCYGILILWVYQTLKLIIISIL